MKISNAGMKTTESDGYKGVSEADGNTNGMLAIT